MPTEYDDGGFSGGNMDRPGLAKLLADIGAKRIDTVVVYKVDRLTRSLADFAKIVEQFDGQGVSFVSVTQQFNTTSSMGRLTLNVLLSFAQFEREVTGERIRDKIAASKRKGMWMGGVVPLGYDLSDHSLIVREDEADRVRQIYRLYLELGCVTKLQSRLDELGIRSKKRVSQKGRSSGDATFSRGSLYELLKNRIYLGEVGHKGAWFPGQHAAIIDRKVWDRAQAMLVSNRPPERVHEASSETSVLAGLLFDADGNRFTPSHTTKAGRRYRYYVSQAVLYGQKARSKAAQRLPAKRIEAIVFDGLEDLVRSPNSLIGIISDQPSNPYEMNVTSRAAEAFKEQRGGSITLARAIKRVIIREQSVDVWICRRSLRQAVGLDGHACSDGEFELQLPAALARIGGELRFNIDGDKSGAK